TVSCFIHLLKIIYKLEGGVGSVTLKQTERSITKTTGKIARVNCQVSGVSLDNAIIHWYRHRPNEGPERILYHSSEVKYDPGFTETKYSAYKVNDNFVLRISNVAEEDNGYYYCAYWD
uniref:Ig-like domain-containing protein n=1 Tax=Latimeria chalumnae TaxID=7897 RepID=H2ZV89_LATCH